MLSKPLFLVLLSMLWLAPVWDAWKARHEKLKMNSKSTKDRFTPPRLGQGHEPWASLKSTFFKPALFSKENEHHYLPWLKFIHNHSWLSWQPHRFCINSSQQKGPRFLIYSKVCLFTMLLGDNYCSPRKQNIGITVIDRVKRNVELVRGFLMDLMDRLKCY